MSYQVISLINSARSSPQQTGAKFYNNMKPNFHDNDLMAFGKRIETFEGVNCLNDLNNYMKNVHPVPNLVQSPALNKAAQEIANEKGQRGEISNEKPIVIYQKIQKTAKMEGKVCQLMCLGTNSAEETFAYFLLDDGLASRKRRRMLLDPTFKYIGVGTANHSFCGTITVILLAENISQ